MEELFISHNGHNLLYSQSRTTTTSLFQVAYPRIHKSFNCCIRKYLAFCIQQQACTVMAHTGSSKEFGTFGYLIIRTSQRAVKFQRQLEFPDLNAISGYIFENRNGCGRRRTKHNKTYIPFFFLLWCPCVPITSHSSLQPDFV